MKTFTAAALTLSIGVLSASVLAAQATPAAPPNATAPAKRSPTLEVYIVDVEGGKASLFISPTGQSLLIDSGFPGSRDTERILAAVSDAGLQQIDYVLSTHYHVDHIGSLRDIAARVPIRHFIDHGPTVETREQVQGFQQAYAELTAKATHTIVHPGDRLPITGLDWRIVTAGGRVLEKPLKGGGRSNPACGQFPSPEAPPNAAASEDVQSVGSVITFGQFRAIDLGDLLAVKEAELICPDNPIGTVDLYFTTNHGAAASGTGALVHGLRPRVAVMHNGPRKGGSASALRIMRSSPGLEDVWQLHWSHDAALEQNSAGAFIANLDDPATTAGVLTAAAPASGSKPATAGAAPAAAGTSAAGGAAGAAAAPDEAARKAAASARAAAAAHTPAYWLKVSARADGSFTVTNARNGFSKTYAKEP